MKINNFAHIIIFNLLIAHHSQAFTLLSNTVTGGWDTKTLAFDVNETSCTALGITSADLNSAIDSAIELWNSVPTSSLKIVKGAIVTGTANAATPVITCSNVAQTDGTAGVGSVGAITAGRPSTGSLTLNGDSTKSAYFNTIGATYRAIVVAHEIGHVLGLGHSEKNYALMYYDISSKENLSLSQDDIDGITWLNARNEFSDGIMGCGNIKNIGEKLPPPSGMGSVAFNWALLILIAFAIKNKVKTLAV